MPFLSNERSTFCIPFYALGFSAERFSNHLFTGSTFALYSAKVLCVVRALKAKRANGTSCLSLLRSTHKCLGSVRHSSIKVWPCCARCLPLPPSSNNANTIMRLGGAGHRPRPMWPGPGPAHGLSWAWVWPHGLGSGSSAWAGH